MDGLVLLRCMYPLLQVVEKFPAGHSYDDVGGGSRGAGVPHHGAHALVGMVMTPQGKVNVIFLRNIQKKKKKSNNNK